MDHVTLTTPELRTGMIVQCHGMRCLIDRAPQLSAFHAGENTYWTRALVLNRADVPPAHVPLSFTEPLDGSGEHRWSIQGNGYACWAVEANTVEEN